MKIGIVGCGFVGSTAAYALILRGIGRELILIDKNTDRAVAEADDLEHAVPFAHALTVRAGEYADLEGSAAVVVAAGVNQSPGETRLDLLKRNAAIFHEVIPRIIRHAPGAVLIVATNPVDIMTHLACRYAGAAGARVLGSGTTLDTARFRALLGRKLGVDSHYVHAYVVGEHGDSEVLVWSRANVGGMSLDEFTRTRGTALDDAAKSDIDTRVRRAAYMIIKGKSATYYGIGSAIARIVQVILNDQRAVLTVCVPTAEVAGVTDVTLSLPRLVGGDGVLETYLPPWSETEARLMRDSASIIRSAIDQLEGT